MNQAVRAATGTQGEIIILAAWCPTCRQEAMPDSAGRCCFCERRIVDEDRLSARALLSGLRDGTPEPTTLITNRYGLRKLGRGYQWTLPAAIQAVQDYAAEHGKPPGYKDLEGGTGHLPSRNSFLKLDVTLSDLVEQAGFPRPRSGPPRKRPATITALPTAPPTDRLAALEQLATDLLTSIRQLRQEAA